MPPVKRFSGMNQAGTVALRGIARKRGSKREDVRDSHPSPPTSPDGTTVHLRKWVPAFPRRPLPCPLPQRARVKSVELVAVADALKVERFTGVGILRDGG